MRVLVTGATGVLGSAVSDELARRGHEVLRGSRRPGPGLIEMDLQDARSFAKICQGVAAIVHCAAAPFGKARAVEGLAVERLRRVAPKARLVYPSIVGCDKIRFSYYKVKKDAEERLVRAGGDHAFVRLTQFHEFADRAAASSDGVRRHAGTDDRCR